MSDVFISYAREDRAWVRDLAGALAAEGWSVWWDRAILSGDEFAEVIEKELSAAGAVIVVWSKDSVGSHWVRDEATRAHHRNVLVPVRRDDAEPPLPFGQLHATDLSEWSGAPSAPEFRELARGIRAALIGPTPWTPENVSVSIFQRLLRKRWIVFACLVSAIALATVLYALLRPLTPQEALIRLQGEQVKYDADTFAERAEKGDRAIVKLFLRAGMDPNARDKDGATALIHAAANAHGEIVQDLLNGRADPGVRFDEGSSTSRSAAEIAAFRGHLEIAEKIDGDSSALRNWALLGYAERGDEHGAKAMLAQGADPNARAWFVKSVFGGAIEETALSLAAKGDHLAVVDLLVSKGALAGGAEGGGNALFNAACEGAAQVVQTLLRQGTSADQTDEYDMSAIACAAKGRHEEVVRALIAAGADVNHFQKGTGYTNCTALMGVAHGQFGDRDDLREIRSRIMRALIDAGADVNARCATASETPLFAAIEDGYDEGVELLLAHGADVNARNRRGESALHRAKDTTATILMRHGAAVDARDEAGDTRLAKAASDGDLALTSVLLKAGADVNARNAAGATPLMQAASEGEYMMVWLLLREGARLDERDPKGMSALDIAEDVEKEFGPQRAVVLLREAQTTSPRDIPPPSVAKFTCGNKGDVIKEVGEIEVVHPSGLIVDRFLFCVRKPSGSGSGDLWVYTGHSGDGLLTDPEKVARDLADSGRECTEQEGTYKVRLCHQRGKPASVEMQLPKRSGYEIRPEILKVEWPA